MQAERRGGALHLSVPNHRDMLEPVRQAALDFLQGHGLTARAIYRLEVVLEEALMNLMWHAFPQGGEHVVQLSVMLEPEVVVLNFEDSGVAFDPLGAPAPPRPASIDDARPGGLGLELMRKASRSIQRVREGDTNRLRVCIDRQA